MFHLLTGLMKLARDSLQVVLAHKEKFSREEGLSVFYAIRWQQLQLGK